jgi:hypothetical protein
MREKKMQKPRTSERARACSDFVRSTERSTARNDLLLALATTTSGLRLLLPALDRRLHVVATALELAKDALGGHLPLEMLDGALNALLADDDLDRLALDGVTDDRR